MTLDDLADLSADKLRALSDQELEAIVEPFKNVTRPELAPKPETTKKKESPPITAFMSPQKLAALKMLEESGVDISFVNHKRRK